MSTLEQMIAKINLKVYRDTETDTFNEALASLAIRPAALIYGKVSTATRIEKYVINGDFEAQILERTRLVKCKQERTWRTL